MKKNNTTENEYVMVELIAIIAVGALGAIVGFLISIIYFLLLSFIFWEWMTINWAVVRFGMSILVIIFLLAASWATKGIKNENNK